MISITGVVELILKIGIQKNNSQTIPGTPFLPLIPRLGHAKKTELNRVCSELFRNN
jgi:hypothetical protein